FEHIETLGVDAGHLRRSAPAILPQRIAMVIVHVLNDSRFLRRGKWICRHEFAGFYPVDPSKSTWSGEHESVRIDGDDLDTRRGRQRHASRLPHGMQLISLLVRFSHASYTLGVRLRPRA